MKTICCPHCQFKFDPNEKYEPPFKINQKVRFVKSHINTSIYGGTFGHYNKTFDFTGHVKYMELVDVGNDKDCHKSIRGKKSWLVKVSYLPYSKKEGTTSTSFWVYQLKKI